MSESDDRYYDRATTWALDEQAWLRSLLRQARIFAGVAALIAVLEAFALLCLTPLKSVRPIPVLVDRQTGFVEVLSGDGRRELRADAALTQSLLAQYVVARESFDITDVAAEYHKAAVWSAGSARQDYLALMPVSNPQSPLRRYPRSALLDVEIKSISPLGQNVALVRFDTRRRDQDNRGAPPHNWAAVVAYRFDDKPLSVDDRLINPLGFQVVRYHRDPEAISTPEVNAGSVPTTTTTTGASSSNAPQPAPVASGMIAPPAPSPLSTQTPAASGPRPLPGLKPWGELVSFWDFSL